MAGHGIDTKAAAELLAPFLADESTSVDDATMLMTSMRTRPLAANIDDPLPIEEMERRFALATKIQDLRWENIGHPGDLDDPEPGERMRLKAFEVSALMVLPIYRIQQFLDEGDFMMDEINTTERLVRKGKSAFIFY